MSNNNLLAEDVITLDRLQEFLTHCDDRYIFTSNPPDFGLSINGHTISIVSGGSNKSVTVPDNDTTYTLSIPITPYGWVNKTKTVAAVGVTASSLVMINPTPESFDSYSAAGISCIEQSDNSLTFSCTLLPSNTINLNVIVLNGGNTLYGIVNDTDKLSISKSYAVAGETITVTNLMSSVQSWTLNGITQTDIAANGTATFAMPSNNVVVDEPVYTITVDDSIAAGDDYTGFISFGMLDGDLYTTLSYDKTRQYHAGETVAFAFSTDGVIDMAYTTPGINQNMYSMMQNGRMFRSFTMPNYDITLVLASSIN